MKIFIADNMITITYTKKEEYENFVTLCSECGRLILIAQRIEERVRIWPCTFCDEQSPEYNYKLMEDINLRIEYHIF